MSVTTLHAREFSRARLCQYRKVKFPTQVAAADAAGVPIDTYRQYESGKAQPSVARLATLAGVLGVPMDELFQEAIP